jgi:hypothetical protein
MRSIPSCPILAETIGIHSCPHRVFGRLTHKRWGANHWERIARLGVSALTRIEEMAP